MADNVTTDELEQALQDLASEMGLSVVEYVQSLGYSTVGELNAAVSGVQSQIDAITEISDNGVESLAEKIKAIDEVITNSDGSIAQILTLIQENKQLVVDETARATGVEADLQSQVTVNANKATSNATAIAGLTQTVTDNKTAQDTVNADVEGRLSGAESTIVTLTGDETVDGSIAKAIKGEADRAKAQEAANTAALSDEVTRATAAETNLQSQLDEITGGATGSISEIDGRVKVVENTLNDTTDVDGNLVKGVKTRVTDLENGLSAEVARATQAEADTLSNANAYTDAHTLKASSMDMCGIHNKFRASLGLADKDCSGAGGDGAVL